MTVKHIDIQEYIINDVSHWRAKETGTEDYIFEDSTADKLRRQVMGKLNCGCIFHFLEDWNIQAMS